FFALIFLPAIIRAIRVSKIHNISQLARSLPGGHLGVKSLKQMNPKPMRNGAVALALFCAFATLNDSRCAEINPAPTPAEGATVQVLVAYYSLTGNTEQMADGVAEGVKRVPGVIVQLKKVDDVSQKDLEAADAILLGSPTYYANLPGKMKVVIDDWSW